jgi:predicted alpha-1,2-mannosidase
VSTTLEYCLADWATAQMMAALGDSTKALEYHRRSMFYRNMFDATTGFLRPRGSDGSWLTPFDPLRTEGSGSWSGSGGPGYVEGNAWDYTWFVPHDIAGLMSLFGGPEPFAAKLSEGFAAGRFTMSNEPDIGNPYVYRLIPGFEAKTVGIVEGILRSDFGVASDGLPGNDDAGAISAWYVFSAMGLYPFCPGSGTYVIGRPVFDRVEITLDSAVYPGRKILIERQRDPNAKRGTETLRLHGKVIEGYEVTHRELVKGGTLTIGVADGD